MEPLASCIIPSKPSSALSCHYQGLGSGHKDLIDNEVLGRSGVTIDQGTPPQLVTCTSVRGSTKPVLFSSNMYGSLTTLKDILEGVDLLFWGRLHLLCTCDGDGLFGTLRLLGLPRSWYRQFSF